MICPFCQHDLDATAEHCPRCFAAMPRLGGLSLPFRLRTLAVGGGMVFMLVLFMNAWMLNNSRSREVAAACTDRSSGGNCLIMTRARTVSAQLSQEVTAPGRSAAVELLLSQWRHNVQGTQNNPYPQGRQRK